MDELPQDAWFYTREGNRAGPVTWVELRAKAQDGALDPRLDMVWTAGMAEWQPAGRTAGLFEKRSGPVVPDVLAATADPYLPPQQTAVEQGMYQEGEWPGARRRSFLVATLIFPFVWNIIFAKSANYLTLQFGTEIMGVIGIGAMVVPLLVGIYYGLKRLVNLGMSRWWYLGNFVPLLNLWVGYRCFACPAGYAYHKQLDGVGVALAILYWLIMLICVVAIIALVAVLVGAIDSPALQDQLSEFLRTVRDQATKP